MRSGVRLLIKDRTTQEPCTTSSLLAGIVVSEQVTGVLLITHARTSTALCTAAFATLLLDPGGPSGVTAEAIFSRREGSEGGQNSC